MVEVPLEHVVRDAYLTSLPAGGELIHRVVILEDDRFGSGPFEVHGDEGLEGVIGIQRVLGVEDDHQCGSIFEVGVEVPPLV